MVLYFADRKMSILGMATTELMEGFTISKDLKTEDTDTGVATFECYIHWAESTRQLAESCASAGNYLLRSYRNENEFYTIIEEEVDTKDQTIYIYAEDAGMDLLNETVGEYSAPSAMPIADYVEMYAMDTGFEIGINEIENLSRTLSWTGTATAAERIASVATQFDNAEISYSFSIQGLIITHKYINIHKKRGKDAGVQLRLNRDVDRIITTTSVADLATALYVTGGTPEESDTPITLDGYEYDDGDMYVEDGLLKSREALAVWSRYVWAKEPGQIEGYTGHIVKQWSYDTTSQSELCNRAVTQLTKVCEPAVNYEIDIKMLPENVGIGDYVDIVDEKGELYLSSRILKLTTSVCDEQQTATLGEFLIVESGITQTVKELAEQFSQLAKTRQYYVWIVYADDEYGNGISLDPEGKTYMGTCTTTAGATPDLSDPSIYKWSLIQGGEGVGIKEVITWYGKSDSPTEVPTEWQTEPYELLHNEYQWSYTETIYTDNTTVLTSPHIVAYYDYLAVDELYAEVANINSLLSGQAGVGELEAIYLTTANAVIDEAVIVDALMSNATIGTLLAGKIYTDFIEIMDNEAQNLYITGSVIQFRDTDGVVRMQMGLDAEGYWNYYILDADGNTIFDALGLTEAGLVGNGAIIRNDAVADDAAISGYKLDIQSVTQYLNEYGGITLEAAQVTIDGERLDYRLDTITQMIGTGNTFTLEFYKSDSPTELIGGVWSTTQPQWEQGKYIWMREVTTYADGTVTTSEAVCITGNSGDGVGIEDIEAYYAAGDSGTVAPSGSSGTGELLTPPYYDGSGKTSNGVTYTVNADGSVTTSGTATGESTYYLAYDLPVSAGQCTLSGLPESGTAYTYQYRYSLGGGGYETVNYTPTSFNISADTTITVWIRIASGISQSYTFTPSLTGTMDVWQTTQPDVGETGYLWMRYKITLTDGSIKWTEPCCLTDGYTRQQVTNLQTELSVVQGQITAKIWESDIKTAIANLDLSTIRNYALLSGAYTTDDDPAQILTWISTSSPRTLTAEDGYIRVTTGTSTSTVFWRLSGEFAEGEKYTVSIRWRASSSVSPTLRAVYSYKNGSNGYYTPSLGSQSVGTDWTDTVVQWTATAYSSYDVYGIGFLTVANTDIDVAHIMVEQGETAHDWVRAPEDYATVSQITTITDQYTALTMELGEIDALVGQMQTTMADDYLELSTKITNLQVTVDGLTFDTSDIYQYIDDTESVIMERVTSVELTASGLTSTVTQISTTVDALGTDLSSRIEQLAGSITLEVSGGLGSNASIVLTVDGSSYREEIDLARVRQAFADDESAIVIEAGVVAFASNTFTVDSTYLTITENGSLYATNATLTGTVTTGSSSGPMSILSGGNLAFYYNNNKVGSLAGSRWTGTSSPGLAIHLEDYGTYVALGRLNADGTAYTAGYVLNNGLNPDGYEEPNIMYGNIRFPGRLHIGNSIIGYKSSNNHACLIDSSNVGWCLPYINYNASYSTSISANSYMYITYTFAEFPVAPWWIVNVSVSDNSADVTGRAVYISTSQCRIVIRNNSDWSASIMVVVGGIAVPGFSA